MTPVLFKSPTLVTLTAPTCAGKNHLLEALVGRLGFGRIVSTTDRAPRDGEIEGVHYFFISTEASMRLEDEGQFAELVTYNGTRYGVTHAEMQRKMQVGSAPPIVILEPSGLAQYRKYCVMNGWQLFNVYVDTPESVRLERLVQRTSADIIKTMNALTHMGEPVTAKDIERVVGANNKRLKAVIEEERRWSHMDTWAVYADGTDVDKALEQIATGVKWRNSRREIYA